MEQRTPEWFAKRAGKLTGSRFKDVMAGKTTIARKKLIYGLAMERISGKCLPTYQNGNMLRGTELEGAAREAYEMENLVAVREIDFMVHPEYDFIGVSPDGLVGDSGLVEIKVPAEDSPHKHAEHLLYGAYAKEYQWQIQGQLWVTERQYCDVVSYWPEAAEYGLPVLAVTPVARDEKAIEKLAAACLEINAEIEAAEAALRETINA